MLKIMLRLILILSLAAMALPATAARNVKKSASAKDEEEPGANEKMPFRFDRSMFLGNLKDHYKQLADDDEGKIHRHQIALWSGTVKNLLKEPELEKESSINSAWFKKILAVYEAIVDAKESMRKYAHNKKLPEYKEALTKYGKAVNALKNLGKNWQKYKIKKRR